MSFINLIKTILTGTGGAISGSSGAVALLGKTVYTTDTPAWYIITGASSSAISVEVFKYPSAIS